MFKINQYFENLEIKPNEVIADLGCGVGDTSILLAETFPKNVVCAVDIDSQSLNLLKTKIEGRTKIGEDLKNIKIIQADLEDETTSPVSPDTFDVAIVQNLFHTLIHRKAFLWNLKVMMKDGGRLLVTDFHTSPLKTPNHQQMLITQKDVERLFVEAGFLVYSVIEGDAHSYAFLAKKPDGRRVFINNK